MPFGYSVRHSSGSPHTGNTQDAPASFSGGAAFFRFRPDFLNRFRDGGFPGIRGFVEEFVKLGWSLYDTLVPPAAPEQTLKVGDTFDQTPDFDLQLFICGLFFHTRKILIFIGTAYCLCGYFEPRADFFRSPLRGMGSPPTAFFSGLTGERYLPSEAQAHPSAKNGSRYLHAKKSWGENVPGPNVCNIRCNRHAPNGEVSIQYGSGWKTHRHPRLRDPNGRNG